MFMKFISKYINLFGVILIITFSLYGLLSSIVLKDLDDDGVFKKPLQYMGSFDEDFYDFRAKTNIKNAPSNKDIVLVKIDDESLQKLDSWPLPRKRYAELIDRLNEYGAKVIAFDVLFAEQVKSCGVNEASPDQVFAEAIENFQRLKEVDETGERMDSGRSVILPYSVQSDNPNDPNLIDAPMDVLFSTVSSASEEACGKAQNFANENKQFNPMLFNETAKVEKHNWLIDTLLSAEPSLGFLNMEEDFDGVFRNYRVFAMSPVQEMEDGRQILPSIALQAFLQYSEIPDFQVLFASARCEPEFTIEDKTIVMSHHNTAKIRWIGGEAKFATIPFYRVLEGKNFTQRKLVVTDGKYLEKDQHVDLKTFFKDKIVFVASTALGAHDLRNTPINPKLPGIYAHMNFTSMLMTQYFYKPLGESIAYSLAILAAGLILLIVAMLYGNALVDLLTLLTIIGVTYYIDYGHFLPEGYQIKLFYCYFSFIASYSFVTFINFYTANAEKKQIKGAFSRYVAPSIVDDMLEHPDKLKVGGEKRDITCMFSDVRDFTSISEKLSPSELAAALNRYMGEMTDIVFETNGTLDKYIGDAIVAFWGAPMDIGDHVNQAVDAAVRQLEALPAINEEFKAKGFPEFKIGLGLNSGECSVGNMGSDQIFAYTALGDNMNLGARLESLCKYYGAQILISEYTYDRLDKERFTTRLIDNVVVKGKTEPVGVYEVLYSYHAFMLDQQALKDFKKAFQLFVDGKFAEAKDIFASLKERHPEDKASNRMYDTCVHWIETPPKPGENYLVTTMKTKG